MSFSKILSAFIGGIFLATAGTSWSQAYPSKPVQLIVGSAAGSGVDFAARVIAEKLSQSMGQQFVVVNRTGAGGSVAASIVAGSAPDGYTMLMSSNALTLYPALYPDLKFNPARDLVPVANVAETKLILVASPSKGWKNLFAMLDYARANPDALTFGSAGVGTSTHMSFERLAHAAKIKALHVPFKGSPEAINEVVSGRVDVVFAAINAALPLIKANQLVPLAVTNNKRSSALPDVPTTVEAGVPNSDYSSWTAIFAPAGTPKAIVERLNKEVLQHLQTSETIERLNSVGIAPLPETIMQFSARLLEEYHSNALLVKAIGLGGNP